MDNFEEEPKKPKNILAIGAVAAGIAVILVLALLIYFKIRATPPKTVPAPATANTNTQSAANLNAPAPPLPAGNGAYYDVQPGPDRALTADEKVKYHFPPEADVWIKTVTPAGGGKPDVYFYQGPGLK